MRATIRPLSSVGGGRCRSRFAVAFGHARVRSIALVSLCNAGTVPASLRGRPGGQMTLTRTIRALAIGFAVGAAACGGNDKTADNAALQNDLSPAAQQQTRPASVWALESATGATANTTAPRSTLSTPTSTVRRTTTT